MDINLKEDNSAISAEKPPFNIHIFPNLLNDDQVVKQLRDSINATVRLKTKNNDLYNFKQSKDLKSQVASKTLQPIVHEFIDCMQNEVRKHLETITGKKLSEKCFDITVSRYDTGNYLLCHNDDIKDNIKQQGRSLAFVYYLNTRTWNKDDGGSLILYNSDSTGEPDSINTQISPSPNTLLCFETTQTSWHSVGEVLCKDDTRLSINGWFHSKQPNIKAPDTMEIEPSPFKFTKPLTLDDRLEKFFQESLNQDYLQDNTCSLIRKKFKRKSEINLINFLVKEKYEAIKEGLKSAFADESNLVHVGPYNKRNYKALKRENMPPICKDLYDAFKSDLFFMLLSRLTGLDLVPPNINGGDKNGDHASSDDEEDDDEDDDSDSYSDLEDEESDESDDEVKILSPLESKVDEKTQSTSAEGGPSAEKKIKLDDSSKIKENLEVIKKKAKRRLDTDPLARLEYRRLEHGSYTLIHDYGYEMGEKSALDVIFHFDHDFEVNFDDGGYISYIDASPEDDLHDMDCELLTVEPKSNCLSIVYRSDPGTCRFLKYISKSHKGTYFDLSGVYYERPADLPRAGDVAELAVVNLKPE